MNIYDYKIIFALIDVLTESTINHPKVYKVINELKSNYYFFPVPIGQISEEQWYWCHNIFTLVKKLNSQYKQSEVVK